MLIFPLAPSFWSLHFPNAGTTEGSHRSCLNAALDIDVFIQRRSSSAGLQNVSRTQAWRGEIYIPTVWCVQSPRTAPLPFLLGFIHFPKGSKQLSRIWHKRFLLHPFPPSNRTWQGEKPVKVKLTANSINNGPSGVKTNQDSLLPEEGTGAGKGCHSYLSWN